MLSVARIYTKDSYSSLIGAQGMHGNKVWYVSHISLHVHVHVHVSRCAGHAPYM